MENSDRGSTKSRTSSVKRTSTYGNIPENFVAGRGSVTLIFVLFRGSFEGNTAIFLAVGRAAELSEVRDPITPVGFRPARRPTDAECQLGGP